jgi:hypothetical protein
MVTVYLTDKKIPFNEEFIKKMDLMIERIEQKNPKLDAVFQNEGGEGLGKTSFSVAQGYYISFKTGIPFSEKNVFLDVKKAIDFAKSTEKQIIIFDEPAKGVLKAQWRTQLQQNLIELLMLSRKKRHFIIFNFVKFYKFNEYIVVDRCLGMAHLYERRDRKGYAFAYIPRSRLEDLYNDAIKKHKRNYFLYAIFTGEFPDVLNPDKKYNILDKFDYPAYEKEKDRVIASIGEKEKPEEVVDERSIKAKIVREMKENCPEMTIKQMSKAFGIPTTTIFRYLKEENSNMEAGVSHSVPCSLHY